MFKNLKLAGAVLGIFIGALSTTWGVDSYLDFTYAKEKEFQLLSMRLDEKILTDRAQRLQERLWRLQDKCGVQARSCGQQVKEEYRQIEQQLREARQQLAMIRRKAA